MDNKVVLANREVLLNREVLDNKEVLAKIKEDLDNNKQENNKVDLGQVPKRMRQD